MSDVCVRSWESASYEQVIKVSVKIRNSSLNLRTETAAYGSDRSVVCTLINIYVSSGWGTLYPA
jgi:hypothetical protein